jgi:hypothetical protein
MTTSRLSKSKRTVSLLTVGWREWAALPDLNVTQIKVKVDTGAATSALHAFNLSVINRDNQQWASFGIHSQQHSREQTSDVEVPIVDWRRIKSSNGRSERRPVIRTNISLGGHLWEIELTLTKRDLMSFRMLLGRQALRKRAVVDVSKSFVLAKPNEVETL